MHKLSSQCTRMGALWELQSDFSYGEKMAKNGRAWGTRLRVH